MATVFIDGESGTTGLRLKHRLATRSDVTIISLPADERRHRDARLSAMAKAEVTVLCLPDEVAREAVALANQTKTRVLDASSAHRVAEGWVYGMPELQSSQVGLIHQANRVSVPGCHATGMIMLTAPLRRQGILTKDITLCVTSLTGYTGGGKSMIATYESSDRMPHDAMSLPKPYALGQHHKHLPEVMRYAELSRAPVFVPMVCDTPCGMLVSIGLDLGVLGVTKEDVVTCLSEAYQGYPTVTVPTDDEALPAMNSLAGFDDIRLSVYGDNERVTLMALYDNLGKGASGTALQCLNVMLGLEPTAGLVLSHAKSLTTRQTAFNQF